MGFVCAGGLVAFIFWMVGLGNPIDSCLEQMRRDQSEACPRCPGWTEQERENKIEDCEEKFAAYRTGGAAGFYGCLFFIAVIFFWDSLVKVNEWCINTQRGCRQWLQSLKAKDRGDGGVHDAEAMGGVPRPQAQQPTAPAAESTEALPMGVEALPMGVVIG